jgi:hypothetical protein
MLRKTALDYDKYLLSVKPKLGIARGSDGSIFPQEDNHFFAFENNFFFKFKVTSVSYNYI